VTARDCVVRSRMFENEVDNPEVVRKRSNERSRCCLISAALAFLLAYTH
jgi:hypothetical protein